MGLIWARNRFSSWSIEGALSLNTGAYEGWKEAEERTYDWLIGWPTPRSAATWMPLCSLKLPPCNRPVLWTPISCLFSSYYTPLPSYRSTFVLWSTLLKKYMTRSSLQRRSAFHGRRGFHRELGRAVPLLDFPTPGTCFLALPSKTWFF